jgi:hypothetical protein
MSAAFRNCSSRSTVEAGDWMGGVGAGAGTVAAWGFSTSGTSAGFSASGAAGFVVSAGICGLGSNLGSGFASSTIAGKVTAPFAATVVKPADWSGGRTPGSWDTRVAPATGKEKRLRAKKKLM